MSSTDATAVPEPTAERVKEIADNLASIRSRIAAASTSSSSQPRLVAVSKLKPASDILAAFRPSPSPSSSSSEPGQLHFGENYAQELEEKARVLPREIRWHFIGGLQTNKCKTIGSIPNLWAVETVDSVKKARALQKARSGVAEGEKGRTDRVRVYVQVNTSSEEAKAGVALPPISDEEEAGAGGGEELVELAKTVRSDDECPDLVLAGLMTIGSLAESSSDDANADFSRLVKTRAWLASRLGVDEAELELSMGMSADFELACQMGSDNVRVGSSVFGQRMGKDEAKQVRQGEGFASR